MARIRVGTDILTQDTKDLNFDSDQACMVLVAERIDSLTETSPDHVETIAHGLGYRPFVDLYQEVPGYTGLWSKSLSILNMWVDSTNLNFHLFDGTETYRFKTVIYANSQNGVIGGSLNNADGRIQVARDGYSLDGVTDLRQLVFSSKKGVMMVQEKRTITVVGDGVTTDTTFQTQYAHGLGYVPQFDAILETDGFVIPYFSAGGGSGAFFDVQVDDTYITCLVNVFGGATIDDVPFRVSILCGKIE